VAYLHELFAAYPNDRHCVRIIAEPLLSRLKLDGVETDLIQGPSHNLSHSPAWPAQVRGHGRGEWPAIHELSQAYPNDKHFVRLAARPLLWTLKPEGVESDLARGTSHNLSHSPAWPAQVRGHGRVSGIKSMLVAIVGSTLVATVGSTLVATVGSHRW
jgi:hypothetical protein